jgi:hypothetical protein
MKFYQQSRGTHIDVTAGRGLGSIPITKKFLQNESGTVKAFNFGPQGNFGPFLASSGASLNELWAKNEQNRICKSAVFL